MKPFNEGFLSDFIEENRWLKYVGYGACTIFGIWILGKSAKILADATLNFKAFHSAMKS